MTVHGSDKDNFIKIEPRGLEYPVYRVSASLRGHTVRNSGIVLVHPHKFLTALQEFERLRSGMVTLRGSEDFRLTIEPDGVRGHAWLSFFSPGKFTSSADKLDARAVDEFPSKAALRYQEISFRNSFATSQPCWRNNGTLPRSQHQVIALALAQQQVLAEKQVVACHRALRIVLTHVVEVNATLLDVLAGLSLG